MSETDKSSESTDAVPKKRQFNCPTCGWSDVKFEVGKRPICKGCNQQVDVDTTERLKEMDF